MPDTITYTALSNVLPPQRLSMYEKIFKTSDPLELHGAYIWSVKASASIHPLLGSLEVALRNSIHICATQKISTNWYDQLKTKKRKSWANAKRDQRNIDWHNSQVHTIKKKLARKTPPSGLTVHDLLVAKMDFGFWDNLLRECFSVNGDKKALWPQCMPVVFPNLPKGHTNASVQTEISILRELRNDIAHNSPIWKHKSVTDVKTALAYVNTQIDRIIEIIKWLSTEKIDFLEVHMLQSEAKRIASQEYLQLCQRKDITDLQDNYSLYKRNFRGKLKKLDKDEFDIINTSKGDLYMVTKVSQ